MSLCLRDASSNTLLRMRLSASSPAAAAPAGVWLVPWLCAWAYGQAT